jgi:CheY-like chemotaxis protein
MAAYRILIVEDQREVSRLLRNALETLKHDFEVIEIPSGEEAILDSSRKKVDLLLADYFLPGMSGIELMHKVRSRHPKAKVILITGMTDPTIRKEVAEADADAFFLKPVPMANFLDTAERLLGLVGTHLPPERILIGGEDVERALPDLLAGLRQDLEAAAVLLLDTSGQVLARAGDLPDNNAEVSLLSSLFSIFSASQKVSRLIGQKVDSSWHVFNDGDYDLIFGPVRQTHALLVIGKGLAGQNRALKSVETFAQARRTVQAALSEEQAKQPAVQEPPAPPAETAGTSGKELEPLLKDAKRKLKSADVNEYWDKAAEGHKLPTKPDRLSFDQAKQLGLTPKEPE